MRAVNDHFTYTAKPSDDGQISVFISAPRFASFWYEPGHLTLTGDAAQPSLLTVTGTPENNVQAAYQRAIEWKYLPKTADYAEIKQLEMQSRLPTLRFIAQYPAARMSAHLLYWQTIYNEEPLAEYNRLFKHLTPAVQQSYQGQQVAKRLAALRTQPVVGQPVADFTVADTAGTKHSLATYRGNYVLLDFWGHWCNPCITAMPKLHALHQQYASKLTIIGIAMEGAADAPLWKRAIRQHSVPGLQLSELQDDKGPVITGYNITAFPTYLLLDRQGRLVARTSDVDEITKKLATLTNL